MPAGELAKWMIVSSSNLATNILLDFIGLDFARKQLEQNRGVELRRGVEDHTAFDAGINNEASSHGLASLLLGIQKAEIISRESRQLMLEILFAQKFNDMIPRGLPESARVNPPRR